MSKEELYNQLPLLLRRLFTWGLLAAVVFLVIWYSGGINAYGYFLRPIADLLVFNADIGFEPGSTGTAQFLYRIQIEGVGSRELTFTINQFNSSMLEVVTLLAMWPRKNWKDFSKLTFWCVFFLVLYHTFQMFIQCYNYQISSDLANSLNMFWEPSAWKTFVKNVSKFDLFILRFWAGFPIFGLGLIAHHFLGSKLGSGAKKPSVKGKAKGK